jgi:hypothetical protein
MPDPQTLNSMISSYGMTGFVGGLNWWTLWGGFVFGTFGWFGFWHGKKEGNFRPMVIGITLMVYPFFVSNPILFFVIGIGLVVAMYLWKG